MSRPLSSALPEDVARETAVSASDIRPLLLHSQIISAGSDDKLVTVRSIFRPLSRSRNRRIGDFRGRLVLQEFRAN